MQLMHIFQLINYTPRSTVPRQTQNMDFTVALCFNYYATKYYTFCNINTNLTYLYQVGSNKNEINAAES